jgi:hypothetical protein
MTPHRAAKTGSRTYAEIKITPKNATPWHRNLGYAEIKTLCWRIAIGIGKFNDLISLLLKLNVNLTYKKIY